MKTDIIHVRVDHETKQKAESVFTILGTTPSNAVSQFYSQVVLNNGFPFDVKIPKNSNNKHKQKETKLTVMCMVYKDDGSFLIENRVKKDWPGITFPGGHVENNENIIDACVREMKEETGLLVKDLEFVDFMEWNDFADDVRHLAMLYRTKSFEGEIISSKEGEIFFIKEDQLRGYLLSNDFDKILNKMKK